MGILSDHSTPLHILFGWEISPLYGISLKLSFPATFAATIQACGIDSSNQPYLCKTLKRKLVVPKDPLWGEEQQECAASRGQKDRDPCNSIPCLVPTVGPGCLGQGKPLGHCPCTRLWCRFSDASESTASKPDSSEIP